MKKRLLLIGGGHAHMVTLARLDEFVDKGYEVTVIQPSKHHYYSGMGPGMLGGTYNPEEIRFATKNLVESKGASFIEARAYRVDPDAQTVILDGSDETCQYDVLSCNAGSFVPKEMVEGSTEKIFTAKPIEELQYAKELILQKSGAGDFSIAILGSGPSSIEIAGNVHQLCREQGKKQPKIKLFGGNEFMSGRPNAVRNSCRRILSAKGVEIIEKGHVVKVADGDILLENGETFTADIIFPAIGVRPSKIFARSGLETGPDGGLSVNCYLQTEKYPNIFGGGDCIYFEDQPLDKVGVYAVRQNLVLFNNLMAALEGEPLQKFSPGGSYLLIYNLGDGQGVLSKWSITFSGRFAFWIKDQIDRKFIRTFQTE